MDLKIVSRSRGNAWVIRWGMSSMSKLAWKELSRKSSVTISLSGISTASRSAEPNESTGGSGFGSWSRLKEDERVFGSDDFSMHKSCATSAIISLLVLNSVGAGAEPKGRCVRRYHASPSRIVKQSVAADIAAWIRL